MGLIIPTLAQSDSPQLIFGTATVGGILGAIVTEALIAPERARRGEPRERRTGSRARSSGVNVDFSAAGAVLAGSGVRGNHSILSVTF
jgi:hypothetical protein